MTKLLKQWWWRVDSILVILLLAVIMIGAMLNITASPAVADRLHINPFHFVYRQFFFLLLAIAIIWFVSNLPELQLKQLSLIGCIICFVLLILVLFIGPEVKGAKRWLNILGVSLQPSEMIKPFYFTITAIIFSQPFAKQSFPMVRSLLGLHGVLLILLILQPDFGMVITFSAVLLGQWFLAGLPIAFLLLGALSAMLAFILAYNFLPHVTKRIDSFLHPELNENYQVEKSLQAYSNGGFLGKGPGEGTVKAHLPDSHTDFIFSVAGEEFGALFSSLIILLFAALVMRAVWLIIRQQDLFKIYTTSAIVMLFAMQTIFNIGVTLNLFPTKGMTLPFISYGGSSILSFAFAFGILLNLTRQERTIHLTRDKPNLHF